MTPAAVVLFVFVIHGASRGPADDVVAACLRALPAGMRAVTQTAAEAPGDTSLAANATAASAVAAVVVTWPAADLPRAAVRALTGLPKRPHWVSRAVDFAPADQLPERARALGLVVAAIVEEGLETGLEEGWDHAPARARPPPGRPAAAEEPPAIARSAAAPAPVGGPADDAEHPGRWAIEAGVIAAYESGSDADDTFGGTLAVRCFLLQSLAVRAGAALRLTQRDTPDITGLALNGALGLGWSSPRFGPGGRFGAGARVDLLAQHQSVRVSGDRMVSGDGYYWSMGADALGEVGLGLGRGTMILLAAGLEEMFTEADVVVRGNVDATLHHTRLVLQLGVLSRF